MSSKAVAKQNLRALDRKTSSSNPFEQQVSRLKHDVLGRKVKGVVGKPMLQRRKAEENRKKTLAVEMQRKHRESSFVDRRFGENNPALSVEDRMLERFMREKSKTSTRSGSLFNLEEEDLTHMGQSISGMDDYALESGLEKVDDEDGNIDKNTVKYSHFGGFEDDENPDRRKSKNEVMAEVIAKSKFHKQERQKLNDEVLQLAEEVDADLDDIRGLLLGDKADAKPDATAAADAKARRRPLAPQTDDYDRFIREMKGDAKAAPTNRLKTEEEKAADEKSELEKLESGKKRSAQADDLDDDLRGAATSIPASDDDDEDDEDDEDADSADEKGANAKPLTYDSEGILVNKTVFMRKRVKKDESDDDEDEDEDDEDEGEDEDEDDEDEDEDEDVDELAGDDDDENEEEKSEEVEVKVKDSKGAAALDPAASIPYTFVAPETHADLLKYVDHLGPADQSTVIHRIRVLYHVKLGGLNRKKLETLLTILFEHLQYLSRKSPASVATVNALVKHVHELSVQFPSIATDLCLRKIRKLHSGIQSAADKGNALPWIDDLVLLKTIGAIFSVSDFNHCVGTRAELLMSEYLMMCPVQNGRQALSGLILCQVFREYVKVSKRYVPEVIHFLRKLLDSLHPECEDTTLAISKFSTEPIELQLSTLLARPLEKRAELLPVFKTDGFKLALFGSTLNTIAQYARVYSDLSGFIEVFAPLLEKMKAIGERRRLSEAVAKSFKIHTELVQGLLASAQLKRKPLQLQKRKAIAIKTYVPKFQEHYSHDRRFDPNKERAEAKKVKAEYKKEFKGAVRELRKDGQFIARQRLEERKEKAGIYKKKMDRIMGDLANLEGAMRGYEKMNKK
ncbi:nucleolar protein 14 [Chytriomyces cf. hyalinus JEL632]|nr:nucleolar protein 14 [Chytriomyces cf. hyalinus JEL632]